MIENITKHTFILTIDKKTLVEARKDVDARERLSIILASGGFKLGDGTVRKDGLYYKYNEEK
jgi:hypothetical protein